MQVIPHNNIHEKRFLMSKRKRETIAHIKAGPIPKNPNKSVHLYFENIFST